jgi:hypothetical protein
MKRRKRIPYDVLFRRRQGIRKHLRPTVDGCVEYFHPKKGKVHNPLIGIGGGKTTGPLRKWILEQHIGPLKDGTHPFMACGNRFCLEYDHMAVVDYMPRYKPMRSEYIARFTPLQIRTARYFRGKLSQTVLGRLLGLRPEVAFGICEKSAAHTKIKTPKEWHPEKAIIRKAEMEALSQRKIYLGPQSLREAQKDIERSSLDPDRKQLTMRFIRGETTNELHLDFHLSQGGVMYVYRRALADLYRELGFRPWMRLASKGVISR